MKTLKLLVAGVVALLLGGTPLYADPVLVWEQLFEGVEDDPGTRSASALFQRYDTGRLVITLTNTASAASAVHDDLLTGLLWDLENNTETFTRIGVVTPAESFLMSGGSLTSYDNVQVGGEFGFLGNDSLVLLNPAAGPFAYGVSSSGLEGVGGVAGEEEFGPGTVFPGGDLDNPVAPNGPNYGIASESTIPSTYDSGNGNFPILLHSVVITLDGNSQDLNKVTNVNFFYGTSNNQGNFVGGTPTVGGGGGNSLPTPIAAGMGMIGFGIIGLRRQRKVRV